MNILVVDDDVGVGTAVMELLRSEGHRVTHVTRGSQALQMMLSHDFDLLLSDVVLPDMPGLEVIRAVKAQAPQLPVIVLSGADSENWERLCLDAGAAAFMAKPVMPNDILREVNLVQKARLTLRVALVDTDRIHRTRLTKTLEAMGCTIFSFSSAVEAQRELTAGPAPSLWVVDAADPDIFKLLSEVTTDRVPVFAFSAAANPGQEEALMRAGVALFLVKPIDVDTLLTQASFLAR